MPWVSLPFANDMKEQLSIKYNIRGIPTLIILNANGETIDADGRTTVARSNGDVKKVSDKWSQ